MKAFVRPIFSLILVCVVVACFARAGSGGSGGGGFGGGGYYGHGSGSGGGVFTYALIGIGLLSFGYRSYRRGENKKKAREIINASKEAHWQYDYLCEHARKMFLAIQDAWMERSLTAVSKEVTYNFYVKHNYLLEEMIANDEKNVMEKIAIKSIEIIGCQDYLDDDLDTFTALIEGRLLDYTINVTSGKVVKNTWKLDESFRDLFVFTRNEGEWLLNDIINNPDDDAIDSLEVRMETE